MSTLDLPMASGAHPIEHSLETPAKRGWGTVCVTGWGKRIPFAGSLGCSAPGELRGGKNPLGSSRDGLLSTGFLPALGVL